MTPTRTFSIAISLVVAAVVVGCASTSTEVLYCDPDDQRRSWREGAMRIDLERRLIHGGDTSSVIYPIEEGHFLGFEAEFPLLLPSDSVAPSEVQEDIVVNDTLFRISSIEGSFGDLWLITAEPRDPKDEQVSVRRSTVLYSLEDGVLVIGTSAFIGEEIFAVNHVPCGNRTIRYSDLRQLIDADD